MKALVAPEKFKGSLAPAAATILADHWWRHVG